MSELMDSRCKLCKTKDFQCASCQSADKAKKAALRKQRKDSKASATASLTNFTIVLVVDGAQLDPFLVATSDTSGLLSAISARLASNIANPEFLNSSGTWSALNDTVTFAELLPLQSTLSIRAKPEEAYVEDPHRPERAAKHARLLKFMKSLGWNVSKIPRDGDCLFASLLAGLKLICNDFERKKMSVQALRESCAVHLLWDLSGIGPGVPAQIFEKEDNGTADGVMVARNLRLKTGAPPETLTLDEYCDLIQKHLYGGELEIAVIAHLFRLNVSVYSAHFWNEETGTLEAERYGSEAFVKTGHDDGGNDPSSRANHTSHVAHIS